MVKEGQNAAAARPLRRPRHWTQVSRTEPARPWSFEDKGGPLVRTRSGPKQKQEEIEELPAKQEPLAKQEPEVQQKQKEVEEPQA